MFGYKIINHNGDREIQFCRNEMTEWVKERYNVFNSLYFDNILPQPCNDPCKSGSLLPQPPS